MHRCDSFELLRQHLHALCQAITRWYQAYRSAKGAERVETLRQQIHTAAREHLAQDIILTYQHVGAALGTPRCFREHVAREALHHAQRELNWMYGESSIQRPGTSEDREKYPAQIVL